MGEELFDAAIEAAIKDALARDAVLRNQAIEVRVSDGVVWLRGSVRDGELRQKIAALAAGIAGVRRVENRIVVLAEPA